MSTAHEFLHLVATDRTRILAEAGLIAGDKRGRWVYWRVQDEQTNFVRRSLGS
jgi:hypothetical protein